MKTGRPRVKPEARYPADGKGFNLFPGGAQGAHGWQGNAYSPDTGLIYIPTGHAYSAMVYDPNYKANETGTNLGIDFAAMRTWYTSHPEEKRSTTSLLQAGDPKTGKRVWAGDEHDGATGGVVATAGGLVFQGNGSGNRLRAFDAHTGKVLWSFDVQTAVLAPPISYELDGKQYIAVSVGGNASDYYAPNYSRLLVFALDGKAKLPPTTPYTPRPLLPPPLDARSDTGRCADRRAVICAQLRDLPWRPRAAGSWAVSGSHAHTDALHAGWLQCSGAEGGVVRAWHGLIWRCAKARGYFQDPQLPDRHCDQIKGCAAFCRASRCAHRGRGARAVVDFTCATVQTSRVVVGLIV